MSGAPGENKSHKRGRLSRSGQLTIATTTRVGVNSMMKCFAGLLTLFLLSPYVIGQDGDVAKRIYNASQESVFLIYMNDSKGEPQALGSAFVVAPRTLVTNAHVVREGSPVLAVGPVRIPITVISRDLENDLAVLSVGVDLTSKVLPLSGSLASPGERVFAIGNPEGLEKTISEGLVSGIRRIDQRTLLQITSPISPGSSGGPVLDSQGRVVGVAVGMLTDGQNLNFAVPSSYVRELLSHKVQGTREPTHSDISQLSTLVAKVAAEGYTQEAESPYQKDIASLDELTREFLNRSTSESDLEKFSCLGVKQWTILDQAIEATRKLNSIKGSSENVSLLAYLLTQKADFDGVIAAVSEAGSAEASKAKTDQASILSEIISLASKASLGNKTTPLYTFALAKAKKMQGDYASALSLNQGVLPHISNVCGLDLRSDIYRDLVFVADKLGRAPEAENWFRRLASEYTPSEWDWDEEGDRRDAAKDYAAAADANERAASANENLSIDYCWAAREAYDIANDNGERVLTDGRKCIDSSVKNTSEPRAKRFREQLPIVYQLMSTVLENRGVHVPALEYIKESLSARPSDPQSLFEEGMIYKGMGRYSECISAAQAAIAASDGRFGWMHFGLGNCFFEARDWTSAAASFKIAADYDKTDAASAFNLALCYERQGFSVDAKFWFAEALKRNPSVDLRAKILDAMKG